MSDLVTALRDYNRHDIDELMDKAADELDRLRAEVAELKEDLLEYGIHRVTCIWTLKWPVCDCGWDEVRARHAAPPVMDRGKDSSGAS